MSQIKRSCVQISDYLDWVRLFSSVPRKPMCEFNLRCLMYILQNLSGNLGWWWSKWSKNLQPQCIHQKIFLYFSALIRIWFKMLKCLKTNIKYSHSWNRCLFSIYVNFAAQSLHHRCHRVPDLHNYCLLGQSSCLGFNQWQNVLFSWCVNMSLCMLTHQQIVNVSLYPSISA